MRILFLVSAAIVFCNGFVSLRAHADEIHCAGLTAEKQLIQIHITQQGFDSAVQVKWAHESSTIDHLNLSVSYHAGQPAVLNWKSNLQKNLVSIEHPQRDEYKISYSIPYKPAVSFKTKVNSGATTQAFCVVDGDWAKAMEETLPADSHQMLSLINASTNDIATQRALNLIQNSDYSATEKQNLYDSIAQRPQLSPKILPDLAAAVFSSNLEESYQLNFLNQSRLLTPVTTALAMKSLADCENCEIHDAVFARFISLTQAGLKSRGLNGEMARWGLAELAFRQKTQNLPARNEALNVIFGSANNTALTNIAKVLAIDVPAEELATDNEALFERLLQQSAFSKKVAEKLIFGLVSRHAVAANGVDNSNPDLQLNVLRQIQKRARVRNVYLTNQINWLTAETKVAATAPENMLPLVNQDPADYAMIENVLPWMADQTTSVPGGEAIISSILAHLTHVNLNFLETNFENHPRGVFNDLVTYAFSDQAKILGNGFNVLATLLVRAPLSQKLLERIGRLVYATDIYSQAESEQILTLIVNHSAYQERSTVELPNGMISTFLIRTVSKEGNQKSPAASAKFSVSFLRALLCDAVRKGHWDQSDVKLATQIQALIDKTASI